MRSPNLREDMTLDYTSTSGRPPRALRGRRVILLALICLLGVQLPAQAYIGPGAGFAVGTTLVAFFFALLSGLTAIFLWPIRFVFRYLRGRRAHSRSRVRRFVVLGLDGMEPTLIEKLMNEGKLPNFTKLKEQGTFSRLGTTLPPLSPVAWSSFLTGCNPGKHNIFDFLTRDKRSYMPLLSSVQIRGSSRVLEIGNYRIPLGKPDIRLLRKGKPFWNVLGENGIFSSILRVPITFPPERFRGVLLSAMCVPDLRGTQGTFSYYTTRTVPKGEEEAIGGERIHVTREGNTVKTHLVGPEDTLRKSGGTLKCPFQVTMNGADTVRLQMLGETYTLKRGEYSPWITAKFKAGLGMKVSGICQFLLINTQPELELYVTPIQIDCHNPAMPIAYPTVYSTYLAKKGGTYATLGLAEDTWALNLRVFEDADFLHQCNQADDEREVMFFDALQKVRRGLCVCVFDGTDRVQHMFWRYTDPGHPADNGQSKEPHRDAIEELYVRMDGLVGKTMKKCDDDKTVLMVISDHGFASFRRGMDLNVWLEQNGYLKLNSDKRGDKYLGGVDWSQTRVFCLGLAGIWLNIKGREAKGIVDPAEADALRDELCEKLTGLIDETTGEVAIKRAYNAHKTYRGPYAKEAPDIIIGYNKGYRVSWEAAIGQPTDEVFHDNTKAWSGDHCIDPSLVPGMLFCNRKISSDNARLMDIGPTVLDMFGVEIPNNMDGVPLVLADANGQFRTNGHSGTGQDSASSVEPGSKKESTPK